MVKELWVKELWPHQIAAVDAACAELAEGGQARATEVAACGTGKTLIAAECSRRLAPTGRVLVLVPTLDLLNQSAHAWALWLGRDAGVMMTVCSDPHSDADARAARAELDELHAPVSTDPQTIEQIAVGHGRVTVFATYASLPAVVAAHADWGLPRWDVIVCDEAHRTASAQKWGSVHSDTALPAHRRLYMTATPRITA